MQAVGMVWEGVSHTDKLALELVVRDECGLLCALGKWVHKTIVSTSPPS